MINIIKDISLKYTLLSIDRFPLHISLNLIISVHETSPITSPIIGLGVKGKRRTISRTFGCNDCGNVEQQYLVFL